MNSTRLPLVTIGIPLYGATSFVPRILENIESIDYPNLEFLLSDRHGDDDVLAVLRQQLQDDPRVCFLESRDGAGWIENYNLLLRRASGRYVRILAQDDRLLPNSIAAAVTVLEARPDLVMVTGPTDLIDAGGSVIRAAPSTPPGASPRPSTGRGLRLDSLGLFGSWRHPHANLALLRVETVRELGHELPVTHDRTGLSFRAWLFRMSLRGGVGYAPGYRSQRCVHPESFTARHWNRSAASQVLRLADYCRAGIQGLKIARLPLPQRLLGTLLLPPSAFVVLPAVRIAQRLTAGGRTEVRGLNQNSKRDL